MPQNKESKKTTIKTLAEDLNISFSTVAKALNHDPKIKKETIELVNRLAEERGYKPNYMAKGLKNNTSKTIGFILNDVENPSLAYVFKRISVKMAKYDYSTLICDSQYDASVERKNILSILSRTADAIVIFLVSNDTQNLALLNEVAERVIILGDSSHPQFSCVAIDYELGGYLSAIEMLEKGHREYVVFAEPEEFPASAQYLKGIRKAFSEYGLSLDNDRIFFTSASIDNGCNLFLELWDPELKKMKIPFTGVLTFCDSMAHGVYKACKILKLSIPDDISVIGYDDNPLSAYSNPPLTTVYLPKERLLDSCYEILVSKLLHGATGAMRYFLEPHLVKRESVRNLNER